jgi:exopolysaccharide production protein ExoQ
MPPYLALFLWLVLLVALFRFDPAKEPKVSAALWVPLIFMFFMASRQPNQWLSGQVTADSATVASALVEGDPLNRAYSLVLLGLGIAILASRTFRWGRFFQKNWALTAYLLFALVSVIWSDFPFPAFKKWFRDLGNYVMILVVITDSFPIEAISTLLRRLGYLLIPLSVVLIKYFPDFGKQYDVWTGDNSYCGATVGKNMLGILCMVCGIYFFWDTVIRWPHRKDRAQKRAILVNGALTYLIWWLLITCNSATSMTCLIIAYAVVLAAHSKAIQRRPKILIVAIPAILLLYNLLFFGFGMSDMFANAVGRTSLSGRDLIWQIVLSQQANPLLGAGYESFWLGPRLERVWSGGMGQINEAHNGYLEVYLNLGYVGLFLLLLFMAAVYRNVCKKLRPFSSIGSFTLAVWTAFAFHNTTEADFRTGVMWVIFLLAALAVSGVGHEEVSERVALHREQAPEQFRSRIASSPRPYTRRSS